VVLDLELEVFNPAGGGVTKLMKRVELAWVPRQGDAFLVDGGINCSVEQVTARIDGGVALRLRMRQPGDVVLISNHLLQAGWANALPQGDARPMR
jgi:hypothetical protein